MLKLKYENILEAELATRAKEMQDIFALVWRSRFENVSNLGLVTRWSDISHPMVQLEKFCKPQTIESVQDMTY